MIEGWIFLAGFEEKYAICLFCFASFSKKKPRQIWLLSVDVKENSRRESSRISLMVADAAPCR